MAVGHRDVRLGESFKLKARVMFLVMPHGRDIATKYKCFKLTSVFGESEHVPKHELVQH